jgi:hypothetical protein
MENSIQIYDVILFYSKHSEYCKQCISVIIKYELPVKMIPLDTEEDRKNVQNHTTIQIKNVPSLLVVYSNNQLQLYVGAPKIIDWLRNLVQNNTSDSSFHGNSSNNNSHLSWRSVEKAPNNLANIPQTVPKVTPMHSDDNFEVGSHTKSKNKNHSKKKKGKNNKNVGEGENDESPVELLLIDEPAPKNMYNQNTGEQVNNSKLSTKGLSTKNNEKVTNAEIMNKAKQMQLERDATLGYKSG